MKLAAPAAEHFERPRNAGRFPAGTPGVRTGIAGRAGAGDMIEIGLRIEGERIAEGRFRAFGCPSAIAAASWLTEAVAGRTVAEAGALRAEAVVEALGLDAQRHRLARLAVSALAAALAAKPEVERSTP